MMICNVGCDGWVRGGNADADYLKSREKYLRNWLEAVFLRQSLENDAYRKILVEFLSQ